MKEALETLEAPEGMAAEPAEPAKKKRITVADLQETIQTLETFLDEEIIPVINQMDAKITEIENGSLSDRADVAADINTRLDTLETATGSLADMLRSYRMAKPPEEEISKPELEFAKPPAQPAGAQIWARDVDAVAQVCLTMNDVLMVCRALKEMPDLPDQEKIRILNIACRTAGIDDAIGLRIRAGVSAKMMQ